MPGLAVVTGALFGLGAEEVEETTKEAVWNVLTVGEDTVSVDKIFHCFLVFCFFL